MVAMVGWIYKATQPPPPKKCGSPNGPPVTSPRIRLKDGRYLAYRERGVSKEKAKYKIIVAHGSGDSKEFIIPVSQGLVEELGIHLLSYDRAGYGDSDPNPKRSVKSEAFDIQELADQLEIGGKFYVIGISMGAYGAWSSMNYIPHRLAGVALVVPVINYWWPSFPANLSREGYRTLLVQDQWFLRVTHYAPFLLYWWVNQKWLPSLAALEGNPQVFNRQDKEIIQKMSATQGPTEDNALQQGEFESVLRDLMVGFGTWDFDPLDLSNPFPHNEGSVHIWQGYEDRVIPAILQRHVSKRLPWIKYHELPDSGHLLIKADGVSDQIIRTLLLGEEPSA